MGVYPDLRETSSREQNAEGRSPLSAGPMVAAWSGSQEPSGMIREILSSDVELARRMLNSNHSDAEILACLTSRGVEPVKAANLLDDLNHGREPSAQLAYVLGVRVSPSSSGPQSVGADALPTSETPRKHAHRSGSHARPGVPWWFILLALIFMVALGYALFEMGPDASSESVSKVKHELSPPPGK